MTEVSPPAAAAAASLTTRGDSESDRPMSHVETTASFALPPPKDAKKYTKSEVISLSFIHGKRDTIDAIDKSCS